MKNRKQEIIITRVRIRFYWSAHFFFNTDQSIKNGSARRFIAQILITHAHCKVSMRFKRMRNTKALGAL